MSDRPPLPIDAQLTPFERLMVAAAKIATAEGRGSSPEVIEDLRRAADGVALTDTTRQRLLVLAAFAFIERPIDPWAFQTLCLAWWMARDERQRMEAEARRARTAAKPEAPKQHDWQRRKDIA